MKNKIKHTKITHFFCLILIMCFLSSCSVNDSLPDTSVSEDITKINEISESDKSIDNKHDSIESKDSDEIESKDIEKSTEDESKPLSDEEKLAQWEKDYRVSQKKAMREKLNKLAQNKKPDEIDEQFLNNYYNFVEKSLISIVNNQSSENLLYAPMCYYLSLSELYDLSSGDAKNELRDLLGTSDSFDNNLNIHNSLEWLTYSRYVSEVGFSSSSGRFDVNSSLWLNEDNNIDLDKLTQFSDNFFTDFYQGDFGNNKFQNLMYYWQYENSNYSMTPDYDEAHELLDASSIASMNTMDYYDCWSYHKFLTEQDSFHTNTNEEITCDYLTRPYKGYCIFGDNYRSVEQLLLEYNQLHFILPNPGTSVYDLINQEGFISDFVYATANEQAPKDAIEEAGDITIHIPKFSIESKIDLIEESKKLGINQIFEKGNGAFSECSNDNTYVGRYNLSTKLKLDENGCSAANFTIMSFMGHPDGPINEDFLIDRPFIFIINKDKIPFLIGIVGNPTK